MNKIVTLFGIFLTTSAMASGCDIVKRNDSWWVINNNANCDAEIKEKSITATFDYPNEGYFYIYRSNRTDFKNAGSAKSAVFWFSTCNLVDCTELISDLPNGTTISVKLIQKARPEPKKERDPSSNKN